MRVSKLAFVYFLLVFSAGFALAFIRIPFLVPVFGVRIAELIEMPVMLAVIVWASRRLVHRNPTLTRFERLSVGLVALALLVAAELAVALFLGARSPGQYVASRDPVSGSVYLVSLAFFAVAPALWSTRPRPGNSSKPTPLGGSA
ncbi:MAG: hypothetical protein WBG81_12750 [Rhodanobacter sp.]